MSTILFLLFSAVVNIGINDISHEFHLSKCTINYNTSEQSVQITMNMFIDDLELALKGDGIDSLQLCTRREKPESEDAINNYIQKHLIIEVDGNVIEPQFLGKEQSDDLAAIWCYLEIEGIGSFSRINISNTIMIDLYDDQKNMTTVQQDKERIESILFTPEKTEENVTVND